MNRIIYDSDIDSDTDSYVSNDSGKLSNKSEQKSNSNSKKIYLDSDNDSDADDEREEQFEEQEEDFYKNADLSESGSEYSGSESESESDAESCNEEFKNEFKEFENKKFENKKSENKEEIICNNCNCRVNNELLEIIKNMDNKINNLENMISMLVSQPKNIKSVRNRENNSSGAIPELTRKTNALEWLNTYIKPSKPFKEFVDTLNIKLCHFECLLESKLGDVVQKIIQLNFVKTSDNIIYPLYSSPAKAGKVYVYTEQNVWELITIEYLSKFINSIQKKLYKLCSQYQLKSCSKEAIEKSQGAISKLSSIKYTQDCFMNRVRYDLHVQLKTVYR